MTLKISRRELQVFRELQSSPFELGGKIVLTRNGVKQTVLVNGGRQNVRVDQIPEGLLWFHTHPNIPLVRPGETAFGNVFKQLKKSRNRDFSVDTIVQPISDDDLLAMTASIQKEKTCMMMVFTPEGVYLMSEGVPLQPIQKPKKKNSSRKLSGIKIEATNVPTAESTVKKITKLPNIDNPRHRKDLEKRARKFLEERDNLVLDAQDLLIPKLNAAGQKKKVELLRRFQTKMGNDVAKMVKKVYPEVKVEFFTWETRQIRIKQAICRVPNN